MSPFQAAVLGLVQGATEFLPVSSSGHLVLVPSWLGWPTPSLAFDVAVHLGTTLSLLVSYARDVGRLLAGVGVALASWLRRQPCPAPHAEAAHLAAMIALGSVPAALVGASLGGLFEAAFESALVVALSLLVTGALLVAAQRWSVRYAQQAGERPEWADALIIGAAQAVAILPGISRSGATIAAGLGRKLSRELAPRFAFLLAIPAILGAGLFKASDLLGAATEQAAATAGSTELALGTAIAFVSGLLAIKTVLVTVQRGRLMWFALYCWGIGLATLIWLAVRQAPL